MEINNKIMKTIEELAEEYCVKNIPNLKDMHLTISTAFEAGFEKSQEWISVDDELPKAEEVVLVRYKTAKKQEKYGIGRLDAILKILGKVSFIVEGSCNRNVTHWRPIEYK